MQTPKNRSTDEHIHFLQMALEVAEQCRDIEWYGVGCVITDTLGGVISTGYTGELIEEGKMRHAEDVAIAKAQATNRELGKDSYLYSTLEPCSVRASGKTPCCSHIVAAQIGTVVYGAKEPFDPALGIVCEGDSVLERAGVKVIYLEAMKERCLLSVVSKRKATKE